LGTSKNYHVKHDSAAGDYTVTAEGAADEVLGRGTQLEARDIARELRGSEGGQIKVWERDGEFSELSE